MPLLKSSPTHHINKKRHCFRPNSKTRQAIKRANLLIIYQQSNHHEAMSYYKKRFSTFSGRASAEPLGPAIRHDPFFVRLVVGTAESNHENRLAASTTTVLRLPPCTVVVVVVVIVHPDPSHERIRIIDLSTHFVREGRFLLSAILLSTFRGAWNDGATSRRLEGLVFAMAASSSTSSSSSWWWCSRHCRCQCPVGSTPTTKCTTRGQTTLTKCGYHSGGYYYYYSFVQSSSAAATTGGTRRFGNIPAKFCRLLSALVPPRAHRATTTTTHQCCCPRNCNPGTHCGHPRSGRDQVSPVARRSRTRTLDSGSGRTGLSMDCG